VRAATPTAGCLSLCLFFAGFGACSTPPPPDAATAQRPPAATSSAEPSRESPRQQTKTTRSFMREHASEALDLRRAVIAGRFDLLHRAAARIASDDWSPNLRPDYFVYVTAVRTAAGRALDARSMQDAGAALGALGDACAACHTLHGGPPQPALVEPLSSGVGRMALHAAAEQAMWEGLFTPSETSWTRGAQRLATAPELTSDLDEVSALASHVSDLAVEATHGGPRGEIYGRLTATCATCHRRLNIEPEEPVSNSRRRR
jgi:cytochrome c556